MYIPTVVCLWTVSYSVCLVAVNLMNVTELLFVIDVSHKQLYDHIV